MTRAAKPCARGGCPNATEPGRTYCGPCAALRASLRPSRQKRGYGAAHDRERARWAPLVAAGGVLCARCGHEILPVEPWDLGHRDIESEGGPEHERCNRAGAARIGNARRARPDV